MAGLGKKNTRFEQPYRSAIVAHDPKRFGLAYDREREKLCIQINGHHLFLDGSYNLTPNYKTTISFGDALDMLKRMLASAANQKAGKTRLIPVVKYADDNGINVNEVTEFCTTQLAYAYGVRRVAVGDGAAFYVPDNLDPRYIILASAELLRFTDEIRHDLTEHPASTALDISNRLKRNTKDVQKELGRLRAEKAVVYEPTSKRWTLI